MGCCITIINALTGLVWSGLVWSGLVWSVVKVNGLAWARLSCVPSAIGCVTSAMGACYLKDYMLSSVVERAKRL